jgi:hypothetical protein
MQRFILSLSIIMALPAAMPVFARAGGEPQVVHVRDWRVIDRESGPVNYYTVVDDPERPFIHAEYRPGLETTVLGVELSDAGRRGARKLRWTWRALSLPRGGAACAKGKGDSAAAVYVTWKRGLKWYILKYVWSDGVPEGTACRKEGGMFSAQATIVLRAGGPLGTWRTEEIDLDAEFRKHFEGGDPRAAVPDFKGLGLLTDGDQTQSVSAADYAGFVFLR